MAEIAPFRALRFDPARVGDVAACLAPPYDVIDEKRRAALEAGHARNVVRLDLPRGEGDARYAAGAAALDAWIQDGTLREDERPGIYWYEQTFVHRGAAGERTYVRSGFIARLRLSPFAERVVLPHEHTLSGPKLDRWKLIRATRAHFSQVFTLYRDPAGEVEATLRPGAGAAPAVDVTTPDGVRHRLWIVADEARLARAAAAMRGKQVMIADGHHRYETMLALRDELRPAGVAPGRATADWGSVFFARAEDPGLLVLPTHRLVKDLPVEKLDRLPEAVTRWFDVAEDATADAAALGARLVREGEARVTFAVRRPGRPQTLWLRLRRDADLAALGPPALRGLDVTVLHGLILGPLLGIDAAAMARQAYLGYTHDLPEALARVESGEFQAGFLMNATKVDQVLGACEAGFVLPQKSTYFQPKLATGLCMARIDGSAP